MDDEDFSLDIIQKSSQIIVSPWIKPKHKIYTDFWNKTISELNFIWKLLDSLKIRSRLILIWISGTNWKSTTTRICYQTLKELLPNVHISWNFWTPLSETISTILDTAQKQTIVIEVSSFMLYKLENLYFDFSILTNIATDHLDRHSNFDDYRNSKLNIIKYTKKHSFVNREIFENIPTELKKNTDFFDYEYDLQWTKFLWYHNKANLQSVFLITELLTKKPEEQIKNIINQTKPLPHRLQKIKDINWISIYDDWICTSSHAQKHALQSFEDPIILIAGGYDKWDSFENLGPLYQKTVKFWIFIWQTSNKFEKIFSEQNIKRETKKSLSEAIDTAIKYAKTNWIKNILFSPGCASFDMFKNVYDRIEQFTKIVERL